MELKGIPAKHRIVVRVKWDGLRTEMSTLESCWSPCSQQCLAHSSTLSKCELLLHASNLIHVL